MSESTTKSIDSHASTAGDGEMSDITDPSVFQRLGKQTKKKDTIVKNNTESILTEYVSRNYRVDMPDRLIPFEKRDVKFVAREMMQHQSLMEVIIPEHIMKNFQMEEREPVEIYDDVTARVERYRSSLIALSSEAYDAEVSERAKVNKKGSTVPAVSHCDVWESVKEEDFQDLRAFMLRVGNVFWVPYKQPDLWLHKAKEAWQETFKVTLLPPERNPKSGRPVESNFDKLALKTIRQKLMTKMNDFILKRFPGTPKMSLKRMKGMVTYHIPIENRVVKLYAEISATQTAVPIQMTQTSLQMDDDKSEGSYSSSSASTFSQDGIERLKQRYESGMLGDITHEEYQGLRRVSFVISLSFLYIAPQLYFLLPFSDLPGEFHEEYI